MTNVTKQLTVLGLSENQAFIYVTLLRLGEARAGELIKRTGQHRNIVYTALEELVIAKLVGRSLVKGVAVYRALSPTRLVDTARERERLAVQTAEELALLQPERQRQEVTQYEGEVAFRQHSMRLFEQAKPDSTLRYLGVSPHWHKIVDSDTEQQLMQLQQEKRLRLLGIARAPFAAITPWQSDTHTLTTLRYHPLIGQDTNNIVVTDSGIAIQSFTAPCLVVDIKNAELAKHYRNHFDFIWKQST